jgi:hypothetical protein
MKKKSSLNNQSFVIKDIKTANKSNQNFYHKNSFSDSELEKAINSILTGEAAVDPKQLTILSSILGRKLKQEKLDTRAYNIKFISFNDLQTIELMEAGLRLDFFPGDSLKSHATINKDNGDQWLFERLKTTVLSPLPHIFRKTLEQDTYLEPMQQILIPTSWQKF